MSATQDHHHGPDCGHITIEHEGHIDHLQDGHLHHTRADAFEEHVIAVSDTNPDDHTDPADGHEASHEHGPDCGDEAVPHGSHQDYLVDGRLHHPHGDHCDDHGAVVVG